MVGRQILTLLMSGSSPAGVPLAFLSRILNEQTNLTLETIARLEHELGTTLITFPEHKQKEGKSQELT